MRTALLIAAVVFVALGAWLWLGSSTPVPTSPTPQPQPATVFKPVAEATPIAEAPTTVGVIDAGLQPSAPERQIRGESFVLNGRSQFVKGTEDRTGPNGVVARMLVVEDADNGELTYAMQGLQFSLKPGVDVNAFLAEHPRMTKLVSNALFTQVRVDPSDIGAEMNSLNKDNRVFNVGLRPPPRGVQR